MQIIYSIIIILLLMLLVNFLVLLSIYIYDKYKKRIKYDKINVLNLVRRLYIIKDRLNKNAYITIINIDEKVEDIKYLYMPLNEIKSDLKKAFFTLKKNQEINILIKVFKENKYFGYIELLNKYNRYNCLEYVLSLNYIDRCDKTGTEYLNRTVYLSPEQFDLLYKTINSL